MCFDCKDEKTLGMWSAPRSRLSSEPYHGLKDQNAAGPDVTLRLSNLEPTASSCESDVSSSKNLRSTSPEEAEPVEVTRYSIPASANPEFYSVEEKTAMLGIAETEAATFTTGGSVLAAARFDRCGDHERGKLQCSTVAHESMRPHTRFPLPSSMVAENEICLRIAAEEHRGYSGSNLHSSEERGHSLHLLAMSKATGSSFEGEYPRGEDLKSWPTGAWDVVRRGSLERTTSPSFSGSGDSDNGDDRGREPSSSKLPSSQFRGVVPQSNGRWGAQIYEKHQRIWLGTFNTEEEAARAFDRAAVKFRGHGAMTNFRPVQDSDYEAEFLRNYTKEQIVEMLRRHTYDEELDQCKKVFNMDAAAIAVTAHRGGLDVRRSSTPGAGPSVGSFGLLPSAPAAVDNTTCHPSTLLNTSGPKESAPTREHLFDKPVTPSDVGKLNRLVIPKQHAERCFPLDLSANSPGQTLSFEDVLGKHWRFRYSYWNSSQSYVLTKGWSRFVKEKKLDAGDIVSFERGPNQELYIDFRRKQVAAGGPSTSDRPPFRGAWMGQCNNPFMPSKPSGAPFSPSIWQPFNFPSPQIPSISSNLQPSLDKMLYTNIYSQMMQSALGGSAGPGELETSRDLLPTMSSHAAGSLHPGSQSWPLKGAFTEDYIAGIELRPERQGKDTEKGFIRDRSLVASSSSTSLQSEEAPSTSSGTRLFGVDLERAASVPSHASHLQLGANFGSRALPSRLSEVYASSYGNMSSTNHSQSFVQFSRSVAETALLSEDLSPLRFGNRNQQSLSAFKSVRHKQQDQHPLEHGGGLSRANLHASTSSSSGHDSSSPLKSTAMTVRDDPMARSSTESVASALESNSSRSSSFLLEKRKRQNSRNLEALKGRTDLGGMQDVTDTSLSLAHGTDDPSRHPWQENDLVESPGAEQLPKRHCSPVHAPIMRKGSADMETSDSMLQRPGNMQLHHSAAQGGVGSHEGLPHVDIDQTTSGLEAAGDDSRGWEHRHMLQLQSSTGKASIMCKIEGQRDPIVVPLTDFRSTNELRCWLLDQTKGRDIVYKDKEGDTVLLDNQNWEFFTDSVKEILVRR